MDPARSSPDRAALNALCNGNIRVELVLTTPALAPDCISHGDLTAGRQEPLCTIKGRLVLPALMWATEKTDLSAPATGLLLKGGRRELAR